MEEENNTGDWCAPSLEEVMGIPASTSLEFPAVSVQRGGIMFPMPALSALIIAKPRKRWYWWPKTTWYVVVRQRGKDEEFYVGPFECFDDAKWVHQEFYAWYSRVYNVIIRTYEEAQRSRK